jgi:hypothetical protein
MTLLASVLAGAGLILATPGAAYAAGDIDVDFYDGNTHRGYGHFQADPAGSAPGDSIYACDYNADGWGIEVQLDISPGSTWDTDRSVNTRGHSAGYCTPYKGGDITEGTPVKIRICKVQGDSRVCKSPSAEGTA